MDERKEFEEWLRDYDPDASTTRADDVYIGAARHRAMHATYASVQMLWDAWKARALLDRYGRQQAASAEQVQALREALHAAAEYIGDRSAGSSTFLDLYDAALAKGGEA